ncbi:hypothetical protein CP10139811_1261, partial [Chlamydia ibidis]
MAKDLTSWGYGEMIPGLSDESISSQVSSSCGPDC